MTDDEVYNPDWEKIEVQGKPEYVNSHVGGWLREEKVSGTFKGSIDAIKAAVDISQDHAIEGQLMQRYMLKTDDDYSAEESEGNPLLDIGQIKEQFGIEVDQPLTRQAAALTAALKESKEERAEEFGKHMSWDTPVAAALGFATLGAIASFTPTAMASGALIGSAVPILGSAVGAGLGGLANFARQWKKLSALTKSAKLAKVASKAKGFVQRPGVAKAADVYARKLRMPVRAAAKAGSGNALEEVVLWHMDQEVGYKYDMADAVVLGAFAPAMFMGGVSLMKGIARAPGKIATPNVGEFTLKTSDLEGPSGIKQDYVNARTQMENMPKLKDVTENLEQLKQRTDDPESIKNIEGEVERIKALDHLSDKVDEEVLKDYLGSLANSIRKSGREVDMYELFPFLESTKTLKAHLKSKKGRLPKGKWGQDQLDEVFTVPNDKLYDYYKNKKVKDTPPVKRNTAPEEPAVTPQKAVDDRIETFKSSKDELTRGIGDSSKAIDDTLDEFVKCLKGLADVE